MDCTVTLLPVVSSVLGGERILTSILSGEQYFASHYYLGHRRFETGEPELFLFGELQDLNHLPPKPVKVVDRLSYFF